MTLRRSVKTSIARGRSRSADRTIPAEPTSHSCQHRGRDARATHFVHSLLKPWRCHNGVYVARHFPKVGRPLAAEVRHLSARLQSEQVFERSRRRNHGRAGGPAAGHGLCHRIGTHAAGRHLLRGGHRLSDLCTGRIEDSDWRAHRRLRRRGCRDHRGARH